MSCVARQRLVPILVGVVLALAAVSPALADGDPASDFLITQPAFLPFDANIDKAHSAQLLSLLAAAKKAGFQIRVAVIAKPYDLGSVPVLYRKPARYAQFLGQELFYWYKGEVLVVMPNGFGVYKHGPAPAADRAVAAALPAPGTTAGNALVAAAGGAVQKLAARRGIDLSHVTATPPSSSTRNDRIEIAGGVAVALALLAVVLFVRRRRAGRV